MTGNALARAFLDSVAGFTDEPGATVPSQDKPVKLGIVDPAWNGAGSPKVLFDGETIMSVKGYPWAGLKPSAGDRVALVPQGHGYVVVGTVALARVPDALLPAALLPEPRGAHLPGDSYTAYPDGISTFFAEPHAGWPDAGSFWSITTIQSWKDATVGGATWQIASGYQAQDQIAWRAFFYQATDWTPWQTFRNTNDTVAASLLTGSVAIARGGTGATTKAAAQLALGIAFAEAGGKASSGGSAGGNSAPVFWDTSTTITLPVGKFTQPPIVTTSVEAGSSVMWESQTSPPTTSAIVVRLMRIGVTPPAGSVIHWHARQATSGSAAG